MWYAGVVVALCGAMPEAPAVVDGSVLVIRNSNKIVATWTGDEITHVGLLVKEKEGPVLYEATPDRVRRIPLDDFRKEIGADNAGDETPAEMAIMQPKEPLGESEVAKLHEYLERQIGRRYSVRGYLLNEPSQGVHCAEFVSNGLHCTGMIYMPKGFNKSPGKLIKELKEEYSSPEPLEDIAPEPSEKTWCQKSWIWCDKTASWCFWCFNETLSWIAE